MDSFGLERSIEPRHALAQQAWKIDNTMTLRSDEVLIDVKIININLASFNEILAKQARTEPCCVNAF